MAVAIGGMNSSSPRATACPARRQTADRCRPAFERPQNGHLKATFVPEVKALSEADSWDCFRRYSCTVHVDLLLMTPAFCNLHYKARQQLTASFSCGHLYIYAQHVTSVNKTQVGYRLQQSLSLSHYSVNTSSEHSTYGSEPSSVTPISSSACALHSSETTVEICTQLSSR